MLKELGFVKLSEKKAKSNYTEYKNTKPENRNDSQKWQEIFDTATGQDAKNIVDGHSGANITDIVKNVASHNKLIKDLEKSK